MEKRKVKSIETEIDVDDIDRIFGDGISCCATAEIGEVVDCLMAMFENMQKTNLVEGFKDAIGHEHDKDVDKFLMLLLVSEVATITSNFKEREEQEDTAKA